MFPNVGENPTNCVVRQKNLMQLKNRLTLINNRIVRVRKPKLSRASYISREVSFTDLLPSDAVTNIGLEQEVSVRNSQFTIHRFFAWPVPLAPEHLHPKHPAWPSKQPKYFLQSDPNEPWALQIIARRVASPLASCPWYAKEGCTADSEEG